MGDMELPCREAHLIVGALKRHLVQMEAIDSNAEWIARAIHDEKVHMARETSRLIEMLNEAEGKG